MLGIDLGRLRQRLGILQRRVEGLERGAPASISNTVPHATEAAWAAPAVGERFDRLGSPAADARTVALAQEVLTAQRRLLDGRRPDFDALDAAARALIDDVDLRGGLVMSPRPTEDPEFNRALSSVELGRLTAFLLSGDEGLQASSVPLVVAGLLADAPLLNLIGLDEAVAREQSSSHGEEAAALLEKTGWFAKNLIAAVAHHHARLDGSGRPGVRSQEFSPEGRILSVAAAYLEQRWPTPDERPLDPRRALREVLLEAESGKLDLTIAFRLLDVSFYPKGTLVELTGGEWAEVVSTQRIGSDLELASLPVVRLLRDSQGRRVHEPIFWNLGQRPGCRVARTLTDEEFSRAA